VNPIAYRFCWLLMYTLDRIPGYCRYYTIMRPVNQGPGWVPRFDDLDKHWSWNWSARWGFRLVCRLRLIDAFADESDRRCDERNRRSGS
jgi:hypothetical protein